MASGGMASCSLAGMALKWYLDMHCGMLLMTGPYRLELSYSSKKGTAKKCKLVGTEKVPFVGSAMPFIHVNNSDRENEDGDDDDDNNNVN